MARVTQLLRGFHMLVRLQTKPKQSRNRANNERKGPRLETLRSIPAEPIVSLARLPRLRADRATLGWRMPDRRMDRRGRADFAPRGGGGCDRRRSRRDHSPSCDRPKAHARRRRAHPAADLAAAVSWPLALGVGVGVGVFTPFDALWLLWNLVWFWFISSAPVRGGTHFLCCCKESKQRKQLPTANACQCAARPFPRSGPTGGVSLAGFHRCWHVEEARASHRHTEWTSSHTSSLALRAHPSGKTETHRIAISPSYVRACCMLQFTTAWRPVVGHEVPGRMNDC